MIKDGYYLQLPTKHVTPSFALLELTFLYPLSLRNKELFRKDPVLSFSCTSLMCAFNEALTASIFGLVTDSLHQHSPMISFNAHGQNFSSFGRSPLSKTELWNSFRDLMCANGVLREHISHKSIPKE